jgi:hypothetical protein
MMTGTIPGLCGLGRWLSVCGLWCATAVCATVALADDAGKPSGAASPLEDVVTRPGPPARMSVGHFDDNPGCVNAKLDIWLARGRHTHQLFTPGDRSGSDAQTDEPIREGMSAGDTTIIVGRKGCRIRIRIDRAD